MGDFLKCQDCGKENETVCECLCPYAEDVNEEEIEIVVCDECYRKRSDDI
jgi:hypothetical protein